jgi:heme exporter protein A
MNLTLTATNLKKVFNRRTIFDGISFAVESGQTLLITGRNGSGKSTLVKIVSNVLSPTSGSVVVDTPAKKNPVSPISLIGLVSPYLQLYDEFSAEENLRYALTMRGRAFDVSSADALLKKVFLSSRKDDPVRTYSSGMKQRMKYAFALIHRPEILILDEPTANLDSDGIKMVKDIMTEYREQRILIVATNDLSDVDSFQFQVDLNATK